MSILRSIIIVRYLQRRMKMEKKRDLKVSYGKSGNGTGAILRIPVPFLRALGITQDEREISLELVEEKGQIIITKR